MARRGLKRHQQQNFPAYSKKLDKHQQLRGARKGERRKNVGRPKKGPRASERHERRLALRPSWPAHVILRAHPELGSLRTDEVFHAIREALITVAKLEASFHVVQFSVQRTHIHLMVEASDRLALAKGMQTFGISAAKHINALIVDADG
ncbi:MAG TPA: hypothetical protein VIV58_36495, partial [Kofleriaceae bacterium]